jgi:hypothetical protein
MDGNPLEPMVSLEFLTWSLLTTISFLQRNPYLIQFTLLRQISMFIMKVFRMAIQANQEKNDLDMVNMLCFTL